MDRIFRVIGGAMGILIAAGVVFLLSPRALSEFQFEPVLSPSMSEEEFPPSRFGAGPANPVPDKKDVFSSSKRSPSRGIASVEENDADQEEVLNDSERSHDRDPSEPRKLVQIDPSAPPSLSRMPASMISPKDRGVQEVSVIANDLGYFPQTIFLVSGVPARIYVTSASRKNTCIMIDSFRVAKQIRPEKIEEVSFTPSASGTFRFYCPVNGMEGQVVVKDVFKGSN